MYDLNSKLSLMRDMPWDHAAITSRTVTLSDGRTYSYSSDESVKFKKRIMIPYANFGKETNDEFANSYAKQKEYSSQWELRSIVMEKESGYMVGIINKES